MIPLRAHRGAHVLRQNTTTRLRSCSQAFSTTHLTLAGQQQPPTIESATISPRWLSDIKARIGKCIAFGVSPDLVDEAGLVLRDLSTNWRQLVAGSEGFLIDKKRAGLHRHGVVWGEQDTMGHVNNVQYVRYAESARCNWTRSIGQHFDTANKQLWAELLSSRGVGLILKSITIDYKFPMTWPDRISVYHKLRAKPDANTQTMILDVIIMSEGKQRPAARCLEDIVVYDYKKGSKTALAPFMLDQFRTIWDLQEQTKKESRENVQKIEAKVRHLEVQSWDRPDAKEDFGSAA